MIVPPSLQKPIGSKVPPELVLPLDDEEELLLLEELEELLEDDEDELEEELDEDEEEELLLEEELDELLDDDEPPPAGKSTATEFASWLEAEAVQPVVVEPAAASNFVDPALPEPEDERS